MSGPHHIVGLSLFGPLVLTVATAPADRVRLLLQTQDEIVLNLREESLAHHHQHAHHSSSFTSTTTITRSKTIPYSTNNNSNTTNTQDTTTLSKDTEDVKGEDEDDEEPRSIIAPYAQLPYTDMQDCIQRLVEKEGHKSLWRGYSMEFGRIFLQKIFEMRFERRGTFALRKWMSLVSPLSVQGGSSVTGWLLATIVESTMIGAAAMAVVYPLSVMHAKMTTDVVRKTRIVRRVVVGGAKKVEVAGAALVAEDEKEEKSVESPTESISRRDSVEWVDHTTAEWANHSTTSAEEQQRQEQGEDITVDSPILEGHLRVAEARDMTITDASTITTTALISTTTTEKSTPIDDSEQEHHSYLTTSYELSHKYKTYRQIYHETLASPEGYLGFYKGFSTVVASAFISRLGLMGVYTLISLCPYSKTIAYSPLQVFITQTALSVVTYPLGVVGNRRMIANPGRYTSSWDAAKQIVERHGWRALFRGVEVVVVRSVVLAALTQLLLE